MSQVELVTRRAGEGLAWGSLYGVLCFLVKTYFN